jgi:hypothetical protein
LDERDRIQPYAGNRFYWQHRGRPVVLIGGSVEDNLFQIADLEAHLDLLADVGGNYVRGTMSSRDPGDVWPFERDPATGLYDLDQPGAEYWRRFTDFLRLTAERDIVVQIEVWDRFDFARAPWRDNPFNPRNNCNYTAEESGLKEIIDTHPGRRENAFFRTVPALEHNEVVLRHQHRFVDRLLSFTLRYGHVLYCMDNETNESPGWGGHWARYIRARADEAGVGVELTEMWDAHDILAPEHAATLDHPELYSFIDISQNNHALPHEHWARMQELRRRIVASGRIRPLNSVKIYGANTGRYGATRDGLERFWRNILGGLASSRFHRPPSGLGLGDLAQAHLRAMRLLTDDVALWACEPRDDLLRERSWNEAYCAANPGVEYAVFFPDGGDVLLEVAATQDTPTVRWLDIRRSRWTGPATPVAMEADGPATAVRLTTPAEEGYWAAVVRVRP